MEIKNKFFKEGKFRMIRCIQRGNPEEYADVIIPDGTGIKDREYFLDNADWLSGKVAIPGSPLSDGTRIRYDYYFLFEIGISGGYKDVYDEVFPIGDKECIGCNRDGDLVYVDVESNKVNRVQLSDDLR